MGKKIEISMLTCKDAMTGYDGADQHLYPLHNQASAKKKKKIVSH